MRKQQTLCWQVSSVSKKRFGHVRGRSLPGLDRPPTRPAVCPVFHKLRRRLLRFSVPRILKGVISRCVKYSANSVTGHIRRTLNPPSAQETAFAYAPPCPIQAHRTPIGQLDLRLSHSAYVQGTPTSTVLRYIRIKPVTLHPWYP